MRGTPCQDTAAIFGEGNGRIGVPVVGRSVGPAAESDARSGDAIVGAALGELVGAAVGAAVGAHVDEQGLV